MALSEQDFVTLGTGVVNARLLVPEILALKQGMALDVEAADQSVAAAASIMLRRLSDSDHQVSFA